MNYKNINENNIRALLEFTILMCSVVLDDDIISRDYVEEKFKIVFGKSIEPKDIPVYKKISYLREKEFRSHIKKKASRIYRNFKEEDFSSVDYAYYNLIRMCLSVGRKTNIFGSEKKYKEINPTELYSKFNNFVPELNDNDKEIQLGHMVLHNLIVSRHYVPFISKYFRYFKNLLTLNQL